jgi:hypothetical protein
MTYKNFTLGDLRALLAPLSSTRMQAVLFALATHSTIEETVLLAGTKGCACRLTQFARDLIRAQPRHLRLDYVSGSTRA